VLGKATTSTKECIYLYGKWIDPLLAANIVDKTGDGKYILI
jgi:hypothetical protein